MKEAPARADQRSCLATLAVGLDVFALTVHANAPSPPITVVVST
jgi:hypothetical protein